MLRELLADYGAWYMILLGALAVTWMLAIRRGCGGWSPSGGTSASFPSSAVWRSTHPRGLDTLESGAYPFDRERGGALVTGLENGEGA